MAHNFFRLPMFGFSLLGFLMICTIVAIAVWAAFRSGESGKNKLGGLAGCAIALALLLIAGIGAVGCTVIAVVDAPNQFFRHGPFKRFEAHFDESIQRPTDISADDSEDLVDHTEGWEDKGHNGVALRLRVDLAGEDVGEVTRWFRDNTDTDLTYTITSTDEPEGRITHLDVYIPMPRHELEKLRDDLRRDLHLRLPDSVRIEVRRDND